MSTDTQLAELLGRNADLFAAYEQWANGQIMLLAGTVDDPNSFDENGGKTGPLGYYPVVNVSGQTIYVPSLARLKALALGGANTEVLEGLIAQVAGVTDVIATAEGVIEAGLIATQGAIAAAEQTDASRSAIEAQRDELLAAAPAAAAARAGAEAAAALATSRMTIGKNRFDKGAVATGFFVNGANGNLSASASYAASDFIQVTPEQPYTMPDRRPFAFYDASKAFVTGDTASLGGAYTVTPPGGAAFIRLSVNVSLLDTYQFEAGASATPYEAFAVQLSASATPNLSLPKVPDRLLTLPKMAFVTVGKNLFNPADPDYTPSRYVASNNGILTVPSPNPTAYSATGFIAVTPGQTYTRSASHQMAFYDANKAYVSGRASTANPANPETFTVPAGCAFARFGIPAASLATFQVELGSVATSYDPYRLTIGVDALPQIPGSLLPDGSVSGAKLPDGAVTPQKTAFLTLGKNLFNKAAATAGFYILNTTGNPTANASYTASDFIAVTPGQSYAMSHERQYAWYGANKAYLAGSPTTGSGSPVVVVAPAGAAFIRLSVQNALVDAFQFEAGTAPTSYEAWGYRLAAQYLPSAGGSNAAQPVRDIILPRKIYALVGAPGAANVEQLNLYFKNVLRGFRGDKLVDCVSGFGRQYEDFWRIELGNTGTGYAGAAAAEFTLQLKVTDYAFAELKSATTTIVPVSKAAATPVRLAPIGDSITRDGAYALQSVTKLPAVTLQGIRHYAADPAALNREGRGGWTLATYFGNGGRADGKDSPFMFPAGVAGADYRGNTAFWKKVINIAAYPDDAYDLDGFQKIARGWADTGAFLYDANGYPTAPQVGWVVCDPTLAAGARFVTWNGSAWVAMASQPATWSFDYGKYLARFAPAFAAGAPTHVSVLLSANDFQTLTSAATTAALPGFKANLDTMIASIRAAIPSAKVIINLPTLGARQDAWAMALASGQTAEQYNQNMQAAARFLLDAYDTAAMETAGTYVCAMGQCVDPEWGFASQAEAPNLYVTGSTVNRQNNWVHPNEIGQKQMGDPLAGIVQATRG